MGRWVDKPRAFGIPCGTRCYIDMLIASRLKVVVCNSTNVIYAWTIIINTWVSPRLGQTSQDRAVIWRESSIPAGLEADRLVCWSELEKWDALSFRFLCRPLFRRQGFLRHQRGGQSSDCRGNEPTCEKACSCPISSCRIWLTIVVSTRCLQHYRSDGQASAEMDKSEHLARSPVGRRGCPDPSA
jgi:hypothetical protein